MGNVDSIFKMKIEDQPAKFPMTDKEILDWMNEYVICLDYKKPTKTHNGKIVLEFDEGTVSAPTIREAVCDAKAYTDELNS